MSGHPGDLELGLRYTHEAADREVQDVQVADDRAEGGRRGRKRLDGGDDHVGALGHGADRAEEDDGDKRDELAEELHGEMRIGGCWEAALKSFVGLLSSWGMRCGGWRATAFSHWFLYLQHSGVDGRC